MRPPPSARTRGAKTEGAKKKPAPETAEPADLVESALKQPAKTNRPRPAKASAAGLGRALVQLEAEVKKLDQELGRLLAVFASADSETKLWTRLRAQRKRLEETRRRWNRLRRRQRELSEAFQAAPLDPNLGARVLQLDARSSEGERFEALSTELLELLADSAESKARRVPKASNGPKRTLTDAIGMNPSARLAELTAAMIEFLLPEDPQA